MVGRTTGPITAACVHAASQTEMTATRTRRTATNGRGGSKSTRNSSKSRRKPDSPWLVVKKSKIAGLGAFARKRIPKGTRIIEYKC